MSQARPIGAAAWLTTHVPVDPHLEFSPPKTSIRIGCAVLLCLTVLCAVFLDRLVPALVAIVWAVTFVAYRSSPQGREGRRSRMIFGERPPFSFPGNGRASAHQIFRYAQQKQSLKDYQAAARTRAAQELTDVRRKWATVRSDITTELQETRKRLETLRTVPNPEIAAARKQSETANWQRDFAKLELNRYSRIRYSHYLKRLITG